MSTYAAVAGGLVLLGLGSLAAYRWWRRKRALEASRHHYRLLFQLSPLALVVSTPAGRMIDVNEAFERTLGHEKDDVLGESVESLDVWADLRDRAEILDKLDREGRVRGFETELRTRTGEMFEAELSVDSMEVAGETRLVWALQDVTERNRHRRQLEKNALYDDLTDLPNRSLVFDRLEHAFQTARRQEKDLSVLFIDLDDFKAINDSYGHEIGDRVLVEVASRFGEVLRQADTLGRLTGDEFVAVLEDTGVDGAEEVCRRLLDGLRAPVEVGGRSLSLAASIGVAELTDDTESAEDLLRASDAAMHEAKGEERKSGFNYRVFQPEDAWRVQRLQRSERIREAIDRDEFVLYYQPVIDLRRDDTTVGAEALIRWEHPEEGLVSPGEFIPFAEKTGTIAEIDRWVLREAIRQAREWADRVGPARDSRPFRMAVNVSAPLYHSPEFADEVSSALEAAGLAASGLQLEITERLSVGEVGSWKRLRDKGVSLAIDDFGTGYSSLRYLRQLEADALKLDRYFVGDLTEEPSRTSVIVRSVLSIGEQMDLDVIAEGVETEEQRDHLRSLGCPYAQGWFFARAMPADEFIEVVRGEGT